MTPSHNRIDKAAAARTRGGGCAPGTSRPAAQRAGVQQGGVDAGGQDQAHLDHEHRLHEELGGVCGEHRQSARRGDDEPGDRPRHRERGQRVDRNAAAQPQEAQVDDDDRAEQQREPGDVRGLGERVRPQRLAHEATEPGRLDRVQRTRHDASAQLDGLACSRDALGAHLVGLVAIRVTDEGHGRARLQHVAHEPPVVHA